ncbi:unnamed protein product, partial [Didymodactylos carnosus]
MLRSVFL